MKCCNIKTLGKGDHFGQYAIDTFTGMVVVLLREHFQKNHQIKILGIHVLVQVIAVLVVDVVSLLLFKLSLAILWNDTVFLQVRILKETAPSNFAF